MCTMVYMRVVDEPASEPLRSNDDFGCAVAEWERQGAALALHARQLEIAGAYGNDGTVSMKSWMRTHLRMTNQRASELLGTGRFLETHTHFADAATSGAMSASQIAIARRTGKTKYASIMNECEQELVELLCGLDIRRTELAVDHWIARANAPARREGTTRRQAVRPHLQHHARQRHPRNLHTQRSRRHRVRQGHPNRDDIRWQRQRNAFACSTTGRRTVRHRGVLQQEPPKAPNAYATSPTSPSPPTSPPS